MREKDGDYRYLLHVTEHCSDYTISNLGTVGMTGFGRT